MQGLEHHAHWRVPSDPNKTVPGTLTYNVKDGGSLNLLGSFKELNDVNRVDTHDIIQGFSPDGKLITLYKCIEYQSTLSQPGYFISKYYPNIIMIGFLFNSVSEITFSSMSVRFSHFDTWIGSKDFTYTKENNEHVIRLKPGKLRKQKIDEDYSIESDFGLQISYMSDSCESNVKRTNYLRIISASKRGLDEYRVMIHKFQNFLTLATNNAIFPISIEALLDESVNDLQKHIPPDAP